MIFAVFERSTTFRMNDVNIIITFCCWSSFIFFVHQIHFLHLSIAPILQSHLSHQNAMFLNPNRTLRRAVAFVGVFAFSPICAETHNPNTQQPRSVVERSLLSSSRGHDLDDHPLSVMDRKHPLHFLHDAHGSAPTSSARPDGERMDKTADKGPGTD